MGFAFANGAGTQGVHQQSKRVEISGTVTDAEGEPMVGVNILEKGTLNGTGTDANGKFTLTVRERAVLQVSYVGFVTQNVTVGNRTELQIQFLEDAQLLDEVVVTGYGTTSRRNLTTSISTIDTEKMKNVPVANITDALAGRTAGLIVTRSDGGINKESTIRIRGGGTPIVVIDGFISPWSDFKNINSDDIESMSLLKDASSTAVYGARAGDGVIVIKTKGGVRGLHVDYSYNRNWSGPTYVPKQISSYDRAMVSNKIREIYNMDPVYITEEVEKYRTGSDPFNYPNTNWQKILLRDFAPEEKHTVTMRGGSDFNRYYVSFQAFDQQSLIKENTNWLKRYNINMSETSEFKDLGLTLNFGLNGYITDFREPRSHYYQGSDRILYCIQNTSPRYNILKKKYSFRLKLLTHFSTEFYIRHILKYKHLKPILAINF
jgi:TonB-linked SusC/RagA family outer membrane protein